MRNLLVWVIDKGEFMALRYILGGVAAASLLVSASGCLVGPINNRLYPSEWKSKRDHPVQLEKDWQYPGEHWEHVAAVDRATKSEDWTGTTVGTRTVATND
jgi:hypothetical protein